jgi:hypothetical protein
MQSFTIEAPPVGCKIEGKLVVGDSEGQSDSEEFLCRFWFLHNIQESRDVYIRVRPPAEVAATICGVRDPADLT